MNWTQIWVDVFGAAEWMGLDMGFWVASAAIVLIVIIMNVAFWNVKPSPRG